MPFFDDGRLAVAGFLPATRRTRARYPLRPARLIQVKLVRAANLDLFPVRPVHIELYGRLDGGTPAPCPG